MNGKTGVVVAVVAGVLLLGAAAAWKLTRTGEPQGPSKPTDPHAGGASHDGNLPSTGTHSTAGTPTTQNPTPGGGSDGGATTPNTVTPLTPEEARDLDADLAMAEHAKVGRLMEDVFKEVDSGRSVRTRYLAGLLAWNLSKHPEGIAEALKRLKERDLKPAWAHTLILAVGGVASKEAREQLLSWLDLAALKPQEGYVLEALHQRDLATREGMETLFKNFRRSPDSPAVPNEYTGFRAPDFDPDVVKATMARFLRGSPDIAGRAGSLLMGVLTHPDRDERLSPEVRKELTKGLLDTLRSSDDASQRSTAAQAVRWIRDADVNAALWEAYKAEPADSMVRATLAGAVAYQARTLDDVRKVFDAMKEETASDVRKAMLTALPLAESTDSSMRDAGARQIEDWGKQERDDEVRLEAVRALGSLFPEGASHLEWALQDLSPEVRAAAEDLVRARK